MSTVEIIFEGVDKVTGVVDDVGNAMGGLADLAKGALSVAFGNILSGAMDKATDAIGEFLGGALEAEKGLTGLRSQIKLVGDAAGFNETMALQLADQFKDLAGGSDDAVIAIEEMGLRMGITGDKMGQFIKDTLNLSQVTGSAENAGYLLALAQEDVSAAMSKARKAGILLTAEQEEHIKKLEKQGKAAEASAYFMDILRGKTEGLAADMAGTTAGKLDIFKEHLMDIGESAVGAFLPMITSAFEAVAPVIEDLATAVGAFFETLASGDIGGAFDALTEFDSIQGLMDMLGVSAEQVWAFGGAIEDGLAAAPAVLSTLQTTLQPITDALAGLFGVVADDGPAFQETAQGMFDALVTGLGAVSPEVIDNIAAGINGLTEIWEKHGETILATIGVTWNVAVGIIVMAVATISGLFEALVGLIGGWMDTFSLVFQGRWGEAFTMALTTVGEFWSTFSQSVTAGLDAFFSIWDTSLAGVQALISAKLMEISGGLQTWIITTINTLKGYYETFKEVGTMLIENVRLGIVMKVAQIISAVEGMVRDAISAAGRALGNANPFGGGGSPLPQGAGGAVFSGPSTGYPVIMHGVEAAVPIEGGSIPVDIRGGGGAAAGGQTVIQLVTSNGVLFEAVVDEGMARGKTIVLPVG